MPLWNKLVLVLSLLGAGCSTVVQKDVPSQLLLDCPAPSMDVSTNGDMARTLHNFKYALKSCNDDKAALREHFKEP